jgi:hypothetical protein
MPVAALPLWVAQRLKALRAHPPPTPTHTDHGLTPYNAPDLLALLFLQQRRTSRTIPHSLKPKHESALNLNLHGSAHQKYVTVYMMCGCGRAHTQGTNIRTNAKLRSGAKKCQKSGLRVKKLIAYPPLQKRHEHHKDKTRPGFELRPRH